VTGPPAGETYPLPEQLGRTKTFGRPATKAGLIVPLGVFGLILMSGILAPTTTWWEKLLLSLALAVLVLAAGRVVRLALIAEPGQLVIRNIRNTHRVPWSQIEAITEPGPIPVEVYRENALARQNMSLQVVLREGAVVSATLYDQRMFSYRYRYAVQQRKRVIGELNTLLAQRR
jgi:hypothetical protein